MPEAISAARLWTVLARAHRYVSLLAEQSIAGTGLCSTDFMILEALLHRGPMTITQIQDRILLASGSMTAAVDRVEKLGMVVRKTTEEDRRARVLELTARGKRTIEPAFSAHAEDLEAGMSVLDQKEKARLYELLKKLGLAAEEKIHDSDSKK